jgi:anti-anti-sigma factor
MVHGLTVIRLAGDLDVATVAELRRQLAPRPSASLPDLAIDLSEVEFMDCAVVGAMIAARNEVADAGGCVRLAGPGIGPRRILSLCQLDEVFCIYDTLSEATDPVCARHRVPRATFSPPQPQAAPKSRPGEPDIDVASRGHELRWRLRP